MRVAFAAHHGVELAALLKKHQIAIPAPCDARRGEFFIPLRPELDLGEGWRSLLVDPVELNLDSALVMKEPLLEKLYSRLAESAEPAVEIEIRRSNHSELCEPCLVLTAIREQIRQRHDAEVALPSSQGDGVG